MRAVTQSAARHDDDVSLGARPRSTLLFFAAAFGISWALQLPAVLAQRGLIPGPVEAYLLPAGLGAFGPLPAALIALRAERARPGALFRQLVQPRPRAAWSLLALLLPGTILVAGLATYSCFAGHDVGPWLYPPTKAQHVLALLLIPLGEELGWRGFALPRLRASMGALRASVVLGALWALWHLPVFLLANVSPLALACMLPFFVAGSIVFSWLYNHGGLLLAVFAHVGAHLNNSHHALPSDLTPLVVHTAGYALVALALVLFDPGAFPRERRTGTA